MNLEQKRWSYMIVAMVIALCSGIGYTWSVFQKPLMENFGWSIQTLSLTFTIQVLVSTMAPVFIGKYQKVLGVRKYILPLGANFIEQHGVYLVFVLFACIFAVIMIPCALLLRDVPDGFTPLDRNKNDEKKPSKTSKDYTWKEMVRTVRYYILVIILTLGATAGLMIMGHAILHTVLQE